MIRRNGGKGLASDEERGLAGWRGRGAQEVVVVCLTCPLFEEKRRTPSPIAGALSSSHSPSSMARGLGLLVLIVWLLRGDGYRRFNSRAVSSGGSGRSSRTRVCAIRNRPTKLKDWETREVAGKSQHGTHGTRGKGRQPGKESTVGTLSRNDERDDEKDDVGVKGREESMMTGLVLERYGDRLLVELNNTNKSPIVCCQRSKMIDTTIVVGDVVNLFLLEEGESGGPGGAGNATEFQGVVTSHEPRMTLLQRPVTSGSGNGIRQMKSIAANVDHVMVVVAASPHVPPSSIDRILVAAHEYGMSATIIVNKIDDMEGTAALRGELGHYPKIGYTVLEVSMKEQIGLDALREHLRDKCSIFVGQSGVGKSSLVNSLLPDVSHQKIGALVKNVNIGSHTTSSARLFHLDTGGTIIDSPGIRELGVWHLPTESIKAGFFEIVDLAKECRFRNCQHDSASLGCAVQRALADGSLSPLRLFHYRTFTGS